MKRIGFIYENLISIENCKEAIINASKKKTRRTGVKYILENIDFYAEDLSNRLQSLEFTTPYKPKTIRDGLSGKERDILVPSFYPDQCAHHAIVQILRPIIEKSSYYWSCANIPNRGISRAQRGVERYTKHHTKHTVYCIKFDIQKFYPSINHDVLKHKLEHKIKDKKFLRVVNWLIDSTSEGLPIGNYTSPWFAELLLQDLDVGILRNPNTRGYVRFADDGVIIGSNKNKMRGILSYIIKHVSTLKLTVKKNYQLFKIQKNYRGRRIDFVGVCFGIGFTTIRKRRALAFIRQAKVIKRLQDNHLPIPRKVASGFMSRATCLKHTNSQALRIKYYQPINNHQLRNVCRYWSLKLV